MMFKSRKRNNKKKNKTKKLKKRQKGGAPFTPTTKEQLIQAINEFNVKKKYETKFE